MEDGESQKKHRGRRRLGKASTGDGDDRLDDAEAKLLVCSKIAIPASAMPPQPSSDGTYGPEPLVKRFSTDMSAADKPFGGSHLNRRDDILRRVLHPPLIAAGLEILQVSSI